MPDAACSPKSPSMLALAVSNELSTESPQDGSMDLSTTADLESTTAAVATEAVMSQATPGVVTYCSTKTQTAAPSNAADFERIHGRPATMTDLERRIGLAGNGRYTTADETLHGAMIGPTFEHPLAEPDKKAAYAESGFQTKSYKELHLPILKAKMKAARITKTFLTLAAEDGYYIWAESKDDNIVHSEQFGLDIALDDAGNAPADRDIAGHFLRNIYKEEMTSKMARDAAAAAREATSPPLRPLPPSTTELPRPRIKSTARRSTLPPRAIPALAPADMVVVEDTPAEKAEKEKIAKEKAAKKKATKEEAEKSKTAKEKAAKEKGSEEKSGAEKSATQNESVEQLPHKQLALAQPADDEPTDDESSVYYEHEELGNPYLREGSKSAYTEFHHLIVLDPDLSKEYSAILVSTSASAARDMERGFPLPTQRKRKTVSRTDGDSVSQDGNRPNKRLLTIEARSSAAQFLEPRFAEQEQLSRRPDSRDNDHATPASTMNATRSSVHSTNASRKPLLKPAEAAILRGPRRDTRRRSRSPHRKSEQNYNSVEHSDKREADHRRRRSRSPELHDGETGRVGQDRRDRTTDPRRDTRTYRDAGHGKSHEHSSHLSSHKRGRVPTDSESNHENDATIDLSQAGMPTPPESNKSTPPRTTNKTEDTVSGLAHAAGRSAATKRDVSIGEIKGLDQPDRKNYKHSVSARNQDDAVDMSTVAIELGPNEPNVGGKNELQGDTRAAQKLGMGTSHPGQKRPRDSENNVDEELRNEKAKRAKKEMRKPSVRHGNDSTVQAHGDHAPMKGAANVPTQHTSAHTEQKPGEAAEVAPKPSKEDNEKQRRLAETKAKIAERHANRKSRASLESEIQRFVPRHMRQSAQNHGADTDHRGGQRDDRRGGRRR